LIARRTHRRDPRPLTPGMKLCFCSTTGALIVAASRTAVGACCCTTITSGRSSRAIAAIQRLRSLVVGRRTTWPGSVGPAPASARIVVVEAYRLAAAISDVNRSIEVAP